MKRINPSRILAPICYLPPFFALLLLLKGKDALVFFHARQAVWIWLIFVLAFIVFLLPGQFFALVKWPVCITAALIFVYLLLNGIIDALRGMVNPLPPLGTYVQERGFLQNLQK